jgi:transcriptional regulator with XRE-family HTH domain
MDPTEEIAEFLTSRRAGVTPEQAGLRSYGERRVPGLRREEVAALAGVSLDYYKRLERGNLGGVSDGVLEGLAEALRLDPAERAHLRDLARAANPTIPRRRPVVPQEVRRAVTKVPDAIAAPALVRNSRFDYIAANPLGRALYAPMFESPEQHSQQRPLHLPRPGLGHLLPGMGRGRRGTGRIPALGGRTRA